MRSWALGLVVVVGSAAGLVLWVAGPRTAVRNGDFEDGLRGFRARGFAPAEGRTGRGAAAALPEGGDAEIAQEAVGVEEGRIYRIAFAARAEGAAALALEASERPDETLPLHAWGRVPGEWTPLEAWVRPTRSGRLTLTLRAEAPAAARVWIDDLAVEEHPPPATRPVADASEFSDDPALARAPDGGLWAAWTDADGDGDALLTRRFARRGDEFEPGGLVRVDRGAILGPRLVAGGDGVHAVYAIEREGAGFEVCARRVEGDEPPIVVGSSSAQDVKPAAAWHDGTLWVAWESNRDGDRGVFAAPVRDGSVGEVRRVSEAGVSSYTPSVAVLEGGEVCVAWHAWRDANYDVFLRRRAADGSWGGVRRLTTAPTVDRNAQLLARGGELWLLYENALTPGYRSGMTAARRTLVARVDAEGLLAPAAASPLRAGAEGAAAAFDDRGRLAIAFLRPRLPTAGWEAWLTHWDGVSFSAPRPLAGGKGMDRAPGLVVEDGRALAAVQQDDLPESWADVARYGAARSEVRLASLPLPPPGGAAAHALVPLVEPGEPWEPTAIRAQFGEDAQPETAVVGSERLTLLFGDLHEHTEVSICNRVHDMSHDESHQAMRDVPRLDFGCITDHGEHQNERLWRLSAKWARAHDDPGRYTTFLGEEWSSDFEATSDRHPHGYYGHRNVILGDLRFPRWFDPDDGTDPAQLFAALRASGAPFVVIPHQLADTGNVPVDWSYADPEAEPVAEIFQVRGSYECPDGPRHARKAAKDPGFHLVDAWRAGVVVGVIASPDHGGGIGKACVYATENSRAAILDALRRRRCYGTTGARIALDVRVGGRFMGELDPRPASGPVEIAVRVRAPTDIDRVEIARDGVHVHTFRPGRNELTAAWSDEGAAGAPHFWHVRVVLADGELAWSSPVWLGTPARSAAR